MSTLKQSARKDLKNESIWDKIGTLGRKKNIKEAKNVTDEGRNAIDSPGVARPQVDVPAHYYQMAEGEERSMIDAAAYNDRRFVDLRQVLTHWLNDVLASDRIIVRSLEEDLYDGQVLQKLIEKLSGNKLPVPEVTQSEEGQRHKLDIVLGTANQLLGLGAHDKKLWSVTDVHEKSTLAIVHLLVALVRHFRAPIRLPENVYLRVTIVKMVEGQLSHRVVEEEMTSTYNDLGLRYERDAFDTLLDHAPEKLNVVKRSLLTFVNKHLNKLNLEVNDLESQFADGVYFCLLMGLLEGYFVPLHQLYLTPRSCDDRVHNVQLSFELMQDAGLPPPKPRPQDIVNMDLKSTLRIIYNLFNKYKHQD